jgi:hypothetical protein
MVRRKIAAILLSTVAWALPVTVQVNADSPSSEFLSNAPSIDNAGLATLVDAGLATLVDAAPHERRLMTFSVNNAPRYR